MKRLHQFTLGIFGIFVLFLFISSPLKAQQHMSGQDQSQHMGEHQNAAMHSTNQHMTNMNQHMMNMNDMMKHMNEMVAKSDHQDKHVKETTIEKTYYYTCPMEDHKHIASATPGDCSECGMKLVAAVEAKPDSVDYYGCPMSSTVISGMRNRESVKNVIWI